MSPASLQNAHPHQGQSDGQRGDAPQPPSTLQGDTRSLGDGQGSSKGTHPSTDHMAVDNRHGSFERLATSLEVLDHQESHIPYQGHMDPRKSAQNIAAMFGNVNQLSNLGESRAFENLKQFVSFEALHDSSVHNFDRYVDQIIREKTLKQVQDWMADFNATEQITWLRGPANIGKTAIALEIARQEQVAATFFFSWSDASRNDGNRLFTTLAWQLAESIPDIKNHIIHFIDTHPDLPKECIEDQFEYLVVQPFKAMENVTSAVPPSGLVVIIDGVDECADIQLQQRFLTVIVKAILDRCVPLRFIISSGLHAHIQDIFDQFQCPVLCIDLKNFSPVEELRMREKEIRKREEELKDREEEIKRLEEALHLREEIRQKEDETTRREAKSQLRANLEEERRLELNPQEDQRHDDSDNELSILECSTSFATFHDASAQNPVCRCSSGTREHVLERIQRWIDNPSAERIFWLHGPLGAGKSAIAQTVASAYKVAATFFFSRSDPSRNVRNRLFPTLAWQLANSIPAIKDHISHSLKKHPNLLESDLEAQFEELIVQPFLELNERTSAVRQEAPVVIIDGIDECLDDSFQQRFLEVIGTAVRNPHFPLRFLISSRPETHIEETVNRFDPPILRIDLASLHDANSDVEHYLRAQFARIVAEKGLDPTWPGQQIVQGLVSRSAGQFLYVTDVIRLVGDADNGALSQLDIILGLKPPHRVSPLAGLDQSYMENLMRVRDQDFLKTFLVLLVARCSISRDTDNLSDDYSILMGDIPRVDLGKRLRQMHSILKFEPYIDVHYPSFLEFLQDSSRSHQYHVSKSAGTRRYLELMTELLIERTAGLTRQPDFHGTDHFAPEFGKLINRNPQTIGLDVEDWEQILRPLLIVLDTLLRPSRIDSLTDGYCQHCQFFRITYDTLTHLTSLRKREDPDVKRSLKSLEQIIRYGDQKKIDMNFGRVFFGSGAIVGILMAMLAHQR